MSQVNENLRVRRTRKLLRDALVQLIEERGFERLTVGEITGRAMVSRAAFYRNYRDKFHLVEQIFDDAMAALLGTVAEDEGATRPAMERWVAFFEHIDTYHRFYGALLGKKGSPWFVAKMRASLTAMVKEHLQVPGAFPQRVGADSACGGSPESLPAIVLGAMFLQSITWWLENDRPFPPREIAARSAQLAGAVFTVANGWATSPR